VSSRRAVATFTEGAGYCYVRRQARRCGGREHAAIAGAGIPAAGKRPGVRARTRRAYNAFLADGFVALPSLGVPDLTRLTPEQIRLAISEADGNTRDAAVLGMLRDITVWDGIITPRPASSTILFGRATRTYEHQQRPSLPGFPHARYVKWIGSRQRIQIPARILRTLDGGLAVFKPAAQPALLALDVWKDDQD
jgi:hypothetical protein